MRDADVDGGKGSLEPWERVKVITDLEAVIFLLLWPFETF